MRVTVRPTIPADLPHMIGEPLPHRIKALTALAGDQVLGIGGIGYRPDGTVIAFVQMSDEARKYPAAIHRAGLMAMQMIRDSKVSMVVAEADLTVPAAARWLERLGFHEAEVSGQKAYVWERNA